MPRTPRITDEQVTVPDSFFEMDLASPVAPARFITPTWDAWLDPDNWDDIVRPVVWNIWSEGSARAVLEALESKGVDGLTLGQIAGVGSYSVWRRGNTPSSRVSLRYLQGQLGPTHAAMFLAMSCADPNCGSCQSLRACLRQDSGEMGFSEGDIRGFLDDHGSFSPWGRVVPRGLNTPPPWADGSMAYTTSTTSAPVRRPRTDTTPVTPRQGRELRQMISQLEQRNEQLQTENQRLQEREQMRAAAEIESQQSRQSRTSRSANTWEDAFHKQRVLLDRLVQRRFGRGNIPEWLQTMYEELNTGERLWALGQEALLEGRRMVERAASTELADQYPNGTLFVAMQDGNPSFYLDWNESSLVSSHQRERREPDPIPGYYFVPDDDESEGDEE